MTELAPWAMVGSGNVGLAVREQITAQSEAVGLLREPEYVVRSGGVLYGSDGQTPLPGASLADMRPVRAAFVTVPTTANGEPEKSYLSHYWNLGTFVATAAKGASANYYNELQQLSRGGKLLGDTATVGGGTGMLLPLADYIRRIDVHEVELTLNGTIAAMTSSEKPLAEAAQDAINDGLAEPGHTSPLDVVRAELDDFALKSLITIYKLGIARGEKLDWQSLRVVLTDDQLQQALEEHRRLMLSMHPKGSEGYGLEHGVQEVIGGFDVWHGNWRLLGGFFQPGNSNVRQPLENTTGPEIGFAVGFGHDNSHGIVSLTGPGAGPRPTASTLIGDWVMYHSDTAPEAKQSTKKHYIRTTTIKLEDIETGRGFDESAFDEQTFYALNNWRTGWEPVFSFTGVNEDSRHDPMMDDFLDKYHELKKRGIKLRITTVGTTVGKDSLTIRHGDSRYRGVTLWAIRDQALHDKYDGPAQVDIWWGMHIQRDQLPEMTFDGQEAELFDAFLPHARIYAKEQDEAYAHRMRQDESPDPVLELSNQWQDCLGITPTNSLHAQFMNLDAETAHDNSTGRYELLSRLQDQDPQFVTGISNAARQLHSRLEYSSQLSGDGMSLTAKERDELQVGRWIYEMYCTEAQVRLRRLGATDDQLQQLYN